MLIVASDTFGKSAQVSEAVCFWWTLQRLLEHSESAMSQAMIVTPSNLWVLDLPVLDMPVT